MLGKQSKACTLLTELHPQPGPSQFCLFRLTFIIIIILLCVPMVGVEGVCVCPSVYMELRGQSQNKLILLYLLCVFWGSKSGHQACLTGVFTG